jgi:hypothetical protein
MTARITDVAAELRRMSRPVAELLNTVLADLPEAAYHLDPADEPSLSAHIAHVMVSRSCLHAQYFHPRLGGHRMPFTKAKDGGTLLHALMLGKGMDQIEIPRATEDVYSGRGKDKALRVKAGEPFTDWKLGAAKEAKEAIRELGRVPMLQHEVEALETVAVVMRERCIAFDPRALEGEKEVTIFWVAEATDGTPVQCRARLDILDGFIIRDLKGCRSAHPKKVQRQIEDLGYDVQAAAYLQAVETVCPGAAGRAQYKWLFCETDAPHPVTPVRFGGSMRRRGELRWQQAVDLWAECIRTGHWPQYVDSEITIEASPWGMQPFDTDEDDEEESDDEDFRDQAREAR